MMGIISTCYEDFAALISEYNTFEWCIYQKKYGLKHVGICLYFDEILRLCMDFKCADRKQLKRKPFNQVPSTIDVNEPEKCIKTFRILQSFDLQRNKKEKGELALMIIQDWLSVKKDYSLLNYNCRSFVEDCIAIAERRAEITIDAKEEVMAMLRKTRDIDEKLMSVFVKIQKIPPLVKLLYSIYELDLKLHKQRWQKENGNLINGRAMKPDFTRTEV